MAELNIDRLIARFQIANAEAKKFWDAYKKAAEYAAPQINNFEESKEHTKRHIQVFPCRCPQSDSLFENYFFSNKIELP